MKRVGQILKAERKKQGRSLEQVAGEIKVRADYLQAIEQGVYENLPNALYVRGFIRNYAHALGLDERQVLPFYRREQKTSNSQPPPTSPPQPINHERLQITPSLLLNTIITIALVTFLVTLFLQYRSFSGTPLLIVQHPATTSVQNTKTVEVVGRTDPRAKITINGEPAAVGPEGNFRLTLELNEGTNQLQVIAENALGKQTTADLTVTVQTKD